MLRVAHLLRIGFASALVVLLADILLGWGVLDARCTGIPLVLTRYLSVSDERIFASALLGLVGIPLECLSWFAIYRMIQPSSKTEAHALRAGIIGCLAFGGCGVHVPCCAAVYLMKRLYALDAASTTAEMLRWSGWFLLPATLVFMGFFLLFALTCARAFLRGHTPYPRWCAVFSLLVGPLWLLAMRAIGDYALTNALATGWISVANLWMTGGLLAMSKRVASDVLG